jgi:hypothetical protein
LELDAQRFLDLVEFILHGGMVQVAVCVVFAEDVEGFFVAAFGDEPAGRPKVAGTESVNTQPHGVSLRNVDVLRPHRTL